MKFTIANDIHLGSKHATHTWEEFWQIVVNTHGLILNGDIFDFANCKKKEIELWRKRALQTLATLKASGGVFVRGNHSLNQVEGPDSAFIHGVAFHHGDIGFMWSKEKSAKYRSKEPGAGFLKRTASSYYDVFRHLKPFKATDMFYSRCDEVIKECNPRAIVLGHFHPPQNIDFMYRGVRILILKRGVQEIEI